MQKLNVSCSTVYKHSKRIRKNLQRKHLGTRELLFVNRIQRSVIGSGFYPGILTFHLMKNGFRILTKENQLLAQG